LNLEAKRNLVEYSFCPGVKDVQQRLAKFFRIVLSQFGASAQEASGTDADNRHDRAQKSVWSETDEIINLYKSGHSNNEIAMEIKISI
jgi:DNA-binding NarL/FixJ family response regulator